MELVIVPAWRRPAWLHATLRRLSTADDGRQAYWIVFDRGADPAAVYEADRWRDHTAAMVRVVHRRPHPYPGNSYSVLEAYREACTTGVDLVFLVEEDVFVGRDFFAAHRAAHRLCPDAFCVSACRNQHFPAGVGPPADPATVYRHRSYQSLGVSFRPDRLRTVLPHATPAYYGDQIGYTQRVFPHAGILPGNAEQDGLLGRVCEQNGWSTVYMTVPRAYHAGFCGYNRPGSLPVGEGTIRQRADRLLAMTADELNWHGRLLPDHTTIDLDAVRTPIGVVVDWP